MPICRRCAICKQPAPAEAEKALESTELLAENGETCRRTSPPSLRSTVSSPGAEPAGAAHGSGGVPAAAGDESNAAGAPGVKHSARAVAVAGLLQSAGRSPARPVARLPERPRPQQLDTEMAQLRVQRLRFEDLLSKQPQLRQIRRADGEPLTSEQNKILQAQLRTQNELLNSLLRGGDTLMLELTKLKVANGQLEDALKEINEATHRYLFWTSDVSPIGFSWPLEIVRDLRRLISTDTISELGKASAMMLTSKETLLPLFAALLLVGFSISSRRHFTRFLERSSARVGKSPGSLLADAAHGLLVDTGGLAAAGAVDDARLWSAVRPAVPAGGGDWRWSHRDGASAVVVMTPSPGQTGCLTRFVCSRLCSRVVKAMRYYLMSIGLIVPLIMALIMFDNLNDREFSASLGRLCFLLICGALAVVTLSLKHAGIPLYLDKEGMATIW